jgi:hypothetical protein
MEYYEVRQIADRAGLPTGKWRYTYRTDEPVTGPFGLCEHEHDTKEAAESCPVARAVVDRAFERHRPLIDAVPIEQIDEVIGAVHARLDDMDLQEQRGRVYDATDMRHVLYEIRDRLRGYVEAGDPDRPSRRFPVSIRERIELKKSGKFPPEWHALEDDEN